MSKQNLLLLPLILVSLAVLLLCGCNLNSNRVNITIKNNNSYYQFKAKFNRNKTERVKQCLNKNLVDHANFSIVKDYVNETIVLDSGDEFKLRFSPGTITIKLYKQYNSEASYIKIKNLCEAVKQQIEQ